MKLYLWYVLVLSSISHLPACIESEPLECSFMNMCSTDLHNTLVRALRQDDALRGVLAQVVHAMHECLGPHQCRPWRIQQGQQRIRIHMLLEHGLQCGTHPRVGRHGASIGRVQA